MYKQSLKKANVLKYYSQAKSICNRVTLSCGRSQSSIPGSFEVNEGGASIVDFQNFALRKSVNKSYQIYDTDNDYLFSSVLFVDNVSLYSFFFFNLKAYSTLQIFFINTIKV